MPLSPVEGWFGLPWCHICPPCPTGRCIELVWPNVGGDELRQRGCNHVLPTDWVVDDWQTDNLLIGGAKLMDRALIGMSGITNRLTAWDVATMRDGEATHLWQCPVVKASSQFSLPCALHDGHWYGFIDSVAEGPHHYKIRLDDGSVAQKRSDSSPHFDLCFDSARGIYMARGPSGPIAVNLGDLSTKWAVNLAAMGYNGGLTGTPPAVLYDGNQLIVCAGRYETSGFVTFHHPTLLAFNPDDGSLLWETELSHSPGLANPTREIVGVGGLTMLAGRVVAGVTSAYENGIDSTYYVELVAVDSNGGISWRCDAGGSGLEAVGASPNGDWMLYCVRANLFAVDASGNLLWHKRYNPAVLSPSAILFSGSTAVMCYLTQIELYESSSSTPTATYSIGVNGVNQEPMLGNGVIYLRASGSNPIKRII